MSTKRPMIGELITSMSPTTNLEFKVLSPTGLINRNMGGIGLGIVAALEKIPVKKADFGCTNRMWSDPVPVVRSRNVGDRRNIDKVCKLDEGYNKKNRGKDCIFSISPSRFAGGDVKVSQPAGFLNSCYLCNKKLHGKDIFMYRGEKAFCSPECRSRQIAIDERPEKYCSSQASSSGANRVITTGIFAI